MKSASACFLTLLLLPGNAILHLGCLIFARPGRLTMTASRSVLVGIIGWAFLCSVFALSPWTAILGSMVRMQGWIFWLLMLRAAWIYWSRTTSIAAMELTLVTACLLLVFLSVTFGKPFATAIAMAAFASTAAPVLFSRNPFFLAFVVPVMSLAQNRTAILAAGVGCLAVTVANPTRKLRAVIVGVGIILLAALATPAIRHKFGAIDLATMGNGTRCQWILQSADVMKQHPWLGVGPDNILFVLENPVAIFMPDGVADRSHNLFFDTAMQLGWPGLSACLLVLCLNIHDTLRNPTRQNRAMLGVLIAYITFGLFNPHSLASHFLAIFSATGICCITRRNMI